jgi:hypothetical protein
VCKNEIKSQSFLIDTNFNLFKDENHEKRFQSLRLFLKLIERSSKISYIITSSLATAAGVMANVATNPGSLATQAAFAQNWTLNKEYLILSMCNQLNQFEQVDERFIEFCISMAINQPFTFKSM